MPARRPLRASPRLGLVAFALGCATSSQSAPPVAEGIYEFITRTGERGELRGRMVYVAGDISLEPEFGTCRVDAAFASAERVRYLCDNTSEVEDLALVIDRRFPTTRSQWTGSVRERRTRTVCVQYTTQNGRQVCVKTETQTYEVRTRLTGPLTFRPRPVG